MKLRFSSWFLRNKYYFLIVAVVLIFFYPIFKGQIPFPGDLLASENPYRESSYLGFVPGSIPNKAQGPDVIKEIYPWRFFSMESLKGGELPFWNPYNFSGNPQLANFQTAIFYPLNLLYFILPFNYSWTFLIMLQPILAGIFMYLFLTKGLNLSDFSGFLGGLAFALSSYMVVWIEYGNIGNTILWLPLILLFVKRFNERVSVLNFASLTVFLTLSFLGGYIQGLFYIYVVATTYFLYLSKLKDFKKLFFLLVSFALPPVLSAFQLLPTLDLFSQSTRGSYSLSQVSNLLLPIQSLLTILAADFFGNPATRNYYLTGTYIERVAYIGVPILFFAIYSFKKRQGEWIFFAILSVISLIVATNLPFIQFLYLLPIPVVSTTVPTRELSIFIFTAIVLASYGINSWEKNKTKSKIQYVLPLTYIILWIAILFLFKSGSLSKEHFGVTSRNLVIPSVLAGLTLVAFVLRSGTAKLLLTLLILFDLFYFFNKITPFSPQALIYPKTGVIEFLQKNAGINRFWGYGSAYIPANFQTVDKTYSPEGNDPLHISRYGILLASSANGAVPKILPRPDANIAAGYGKEDLRTNFYRKRILDLLGVKYLIHKSQSEDSETFPENSYKLVWTDGVLQAYENKNSSPRVFTANEYIVYRNSDDVLKDIYNKEINLEKTLLLEENPDLNIDKDSKGSVKLLSYKPNKVEIETNSTGNILLFISDNYYPEWRARVDGNDTKVLVADYTFRAVAVPKGEHIIMLNYLPKSFMLGAKISIVGFIVFLVLTMLVKKYEKK